MSTPLDGVRSASSVRAESSETTLTVVMGDESPLPRKRPVTAPPSSSSSRQHHHNEVEAPEKHRPGGSHKPHQGEYRHTDPVVAARASLIAKERMKLDYCEDSGDDVSRTTMPDEESAKRNSTEAAADKETAAVDQTGAAPGKGSGGAAGSAPANKFTLNDPHVVVRPSRKGMRLNDPDEFFKSTSPVAVREEVDATPLLPVRRTSSVAKAPTPCENSASPKPSSGPQSIYASASESSKHDTKTSASDKTQPRAPANTRATTRTTTPASTRPSTQGNTDVEGTNYRRRSRHKRKSKARKEQGTERVLAISRALRASSRPDGPVACTPVSSPLNTPTTTTPSTPPSTPVSTSPCKAECECARKSETKTKKRVGSGVSCRPIDTPTSSGSRSSKMSAQASIPDNTHASTPTIRPGSTPESSVTSRGQSKQVRGSVNKTLKLTPSTVGNRSLSASPVMYPQAGLQNVSGSLPRDVHAGIPSRVPSWSRCHTSTEWSTATQSSMPASTTTVPNISRNSQRSIPEILPTNTQVKIPSNVPESVPNSALVKPISVNESPSLTTKLPPNFLKSSAECSPDSIVKCLPEANLQETNRPVNRPSSGATSANGSRPVSSSTSSKPASRPASMQVPRASAKTQANPTPRSAPNSLESAQDREQCRRANTSENRRPTSSSSDTTGGLTRALASKLRSNERGDQGKPTFPTAGKPPRILGNKKEMKERFDTIPEGIQESRNLPSIILLLDTDAFFQNVLLM